MSDKRGPMELVFGQIHGNSFPGLSLALMALLLAVSANIGVSTMVSSFRLTFVAFLDQRLAPELFVQVDAADQSAGLEAFLQSNADEVLPLLSIQTQIVRAACVRLFGVRVGPTYRENWSFLDATLAAWDKVEAGEAVVVNEQLARRADLWIGDVVQIASDMGLPIAAVVGDYGNPAWASGVVRNPVPQASTQTCRPCSSASARHMPRACANRSPARSASPTAPSSIRPPSSPCHCKCLSARLL